MKRRGLLLGSGPAIVALFGCLGQLRERKSPTEVVDWEAEKGGIDTDASAFDPAEISTSRSDATVTVTGTSPAGNACGYLKIHEPTYDPEESILRISLSSGSKRQECGDVFNAKTYRVTVQFDRGVPEEIVVREPGETTRTEPA